MQVRVIYLCPEIISFRELLSTFGVKFQSLKISDLSNFRLDHYRKFSWLWKVNIFLFRASKEKLYWLSWVMPHLQNSFLQVSISIFPKNFRRSLENIFWAYNLKISCRWSILFTILLYHLVNRAFLKGAISLNKSVNFEGSYDHPKATKFWSQLTSPICPEPPWLEFTISVILTIFIMFCSFVTSNNKKNVSLLENVVK